MTDSQTITILLIKDKMVRRYVPVKQHITVNSANPRNTQKLRDKTHDDKNLSIPSAEHFVLSTVLES